MNPSSEKIIGNLYLYPISGRNQTEVHNPYIENLVVALCSHYRVVNAANPSSKGILDVLQYIRILDIIFLNWIEDLPDKHRGVWQTIFFLIMLRVFRIRGIMVVWILHNKRSHYRKHTPLKKILFNQILRWSDLVITHAKEGLDLIPPKKAAAWIPHPVRPIPIPALPGDEPVYDVIIWGNVTPYKGIDKFLDYLKERGMLGTYKILIAGKVTTPELQKKLHEYINESDRIELINQFVPEPELMKLIRQSRLVLITYHSESVLSSGVLMDSFSQLVPIIGPHTGAFRDLGELGLIDTFEDYGQLLDTMEIRLHSEEDRNSRSEKMRHYMEENTWEHYSQQLSELIEKARQ